MGVSKIDRKMEGWLYLIRSNRFGLQYSRKRYFILEDNCLKSFKSIPVAESDEEPVRSAIIDTCIRVTDDGRETLRRKVFFIFTLYNASNHNDQLKLGVSSPEDAAAWIHSLQDAALNPGENFRTSSKRKWQPFRMNFSRRRMHKRNTNQTSLLSMHVNAMTSDVITPSPWKIFGCENGLRFFKEAKDKDSGGRHWDYHPAIMAVGMVDGTSEAVFQILMSLGSSRSEWDFCFYRGNVVEHLDGHTDIVHMQLYNNWLPWGMKRRDFLLRRYWRREDDGTYVILYHSVFHRKCPPMQGYIRACLKSGGFVVSPVNHGKGSIVKHMLAIDWKSWKFRLQRSSARSMTIHMLGRVSALKEMFRVKAGNSYSDISSEVLSRRNAILCQSGRDESEREIKSINMEGGKGNTDDETRRPLSRASSLISFDDVGDEFFDVPEPSDDDQLEIKWPSNQSTQLGCSDSCQTKLSSTSHFVKKLHDFAVQKKGYIDLQEAAWEDNRSYCYGATLLKDPIFSLPCSWAAADPSTFLIRGDSYLEDRQKIKARGTLMQMVAADWIRSNKREDNLGSRPGGIVQKYAAQGRQEFFFIVNIQVPGTTTYSLALYYMMTTPLEDVPLLQRFVNGVDTFRNSRFKLIPYISKGSWIVKQSVGKKACLVGKALEIHYFRGKNYLELGIDVGSSTVASGVVSLVLGYLNNLVIEMAFLIQADTEQDLPEMLLGTCRLNHLDASKSVPIDSIASYKNI